MVEDLSRSGLTPIDLDARSLDLPERAATGLPATINGYVIPYYDIDGKRIPFYRVRCFGIEPKYKQPKNSPNHIYFPRGFRQSLNGHKYVVLTEGEKKAAAAVKAGIPCVAVSGVDSWKNRTILMPEDTQLSKKGNSIIAKIDSGSEIYESEGNLATGMRDLIDLIVNMNLNVVIAYDSTRGTTPYEVQRAAATLAFEFRFNGIPVRNIRQLVLPEISGEDKVGLDDYLVCNEVQELEGLIAHTINRRTAFPRHPNIREYVAKKLQRSKLSRKETQSIALAILADLDGRGIRLRSSTEGQLYYFDGASRRLMKASISQSHGELITDKDFARFLYQTYGIANADNRLMSWLATQYSSEDPIEEVEPHKVVTANKQARTPNNPINEPDCIRYQINDGQYVKITSDSEQPIQICDNGFEGHLFESGQVQPLEANKLLAEFDRQYKEYKKAPKKFKPWWLDVLNEVRLRDASERNKVVIAMLYYLSPFINKWRGTQLPIELVLGESGSGKSSLYSVRLHILTGEAILRNAPNDIKDWTASITQSGGLHVTDNVQLVDKMLRQKMSDDICRIITEPNPFIEMRKYYTNNELMRVPVQATFVMTAIQQPFQATDLLQRAVLVELDKSSQMEDETNAIEYDTSWVETQINRPGGRIAWFAHQLLALHLFLKAVQTNWDYRYKAKHRLINFEQSLIRMAEVFNLDASWVPEFLTVSTNENISDADWALQGLIEFADYCRKQMKPHSSVRFGAKEVADWAKEQEEYANCQQLTNGRKLGRYFTSHKQMIATLSGIVEDGTSNNRQMYRLTKE